MAILGVTYGELINILYPLLILSLVVICGFIYRFEDGNIEIPKIHKINYKNVYLIFLPFILTLVLSGLTDRYLPLFCGFTLYLVSYSNSWGKLLKHVNWKLVISVGVVIVFSNFISQYNEQIKNNKNMNFLNIQVYQENRFETKILEIKTYFQALNAFQ